MKVKFAKRIYEVLFTKEHAGLTMYAVEDEPNHIDWLINVEVIDAQKKELKKIHVIDEGKAEMDYCFTKMMNGERVSSAWSEEDETALQDALWCCKQAASIAKVENETGTCWFAEKWLKSLKPQNQWSEEDENMLNNIINLIRGGAHYAYEEEIEWLKSIKPQNK